MLIKTCQSKSTFDKSKIEIKYFWLQKLSSVLCIYNSKNCVNKSRFLYVEDIEDVLNIIKNHK